MELLPAPPQDLVDANLERVLQPDGVKFLSHHPDDDPPDGCPSRCAAAGRSPY